MALPIAGQGQEDSPHPKIDLVSPAAWWQKITNPNTADTPRRGKAIVTPVSIIFEFFGDSHLLDLVCSFLHRR